MTAKGPIVLAVSLVMLAASSTTAAINHSGREEITLQPGKIPPGVTWSKNLTLKADGLSVRQATAEGVWIQTHGVPIGLAWRPPRGCNLTLSVHGHAKKEIGLSLQVRYGIDGVHWSGWRDVEKAQNAKKEVLASFKHQVDVSSEAAKKYHELRAVWLKTDPNWSSDEEELCYWIASKNPGFFESELPFIGYVQFRVKAASLASDVRMGKLSVDISWGMGGLHSLPKAGHKPDHDKKWCFDLRRATPQAAWRAVLKAMSNGEKATLKRLTTPDGYKSLTLRSGGKQLSAEGLKLLVKSWSTFAVHWKQQTASKAFATIGPEVKAQGLDFKFTKEGWKLDRWSPGR